MKALDVVTLLIIVIGGLNWGLVGLFDLDLVAGIVGDDTLLARVVYTLVGLAAVWQIGPLTRALSGD